MWPEKPGSMNPAVECVSSPRRPERGLALETAGQVVGEGEDLERRPQDELTRVQHERVVAFWLDERREVVLLL